MESTWCANLFVIDRAGMSSSDIAVFSHRRSGTHLTIDTIRNNFAGYQDEPVNIDALRDPDRSPTVRTKLFSRSDPSCKIVMKSHSPASVANHFVGDRPLQDAKRAIRNARKICVYRDGRDVLTSLYFYLREATQDFESVSLSQFLRMSVLPSKRPSYRHLDVVEYWNEHVRGWQSRSDVLHLSYESMLHDYYAVVERLSKFLGRSMPSTVRSVVREGKRPTQTGLRSRMKEKLFKLYNQHVHGLHFSTVNFRSGRSGLYEELFSTQDLEYFESKASDAMRLLGDYCPSSPHNEN